MRPSGKKTVIFVAGRLAPEFSPAIAGSFHDVIVPWKIFATTSGVNVRSVTPLTLNSDPDRNRHHRQIERRPTASLVCGGDLTLRRTEGGVRAAEINLAAVKLLHTRARTGRVVGDRRAAALRLVLLNPLTDHVLLRRRALPFKDPVAQLTAAALDEPPPTSSRCQPPPSCCYSNYRSNRTLSVRRRLQSRRRR